MERYDVYMYNVPKVSPDDKVIPIDPHQTEDFTSLEDAQKCAADNKGKFDRVTVIRTVEEKQKLMERYTDGEHEVPEQEEESESESEE